MDIVHVAVFSVAVFSVAVVIMAVVSVSLVSVALVNVALVSVTGFCKAHIAWYDWRGWLSRQSASAHFWLAGHLI